MLDSEIMSCLNDSKIEVMIITNHPQDAVLLMQEMNSYKQLQKEPSLSKTENEIKDPKAQALQRMIYTFNDLSEKIPQHLIRKVLVIDDFIKIQKVITLNQKLCDPQFPQFQNCEFIYYYEDPEVEDEYDYVITKKNEYETLVDRLDKLLCIAKYGGLQLQQQMEPDKNKVEYLKKKDYKDNLIGEPGQGIILPNSMTQAVYEEFMRHLNQLVKDKQLDYQNFKDSNLRRLESRMQQDDEFFRQYQQLRSIRDSSQSENKAVAVTAPVNGIFVGFLIQPSIMKGFCQITKADKAFKKKKDALSRVYFNAVKELREFDLLDEKLLPKLEHYKIIPKPEEEEEKKAHEILIESKHQKDDNEEFWKTRVKRRRLCQYFEIYNDTIRNLGFSYLMRGKHKNHHEKVTGINREVIIHAVPFEFANKDILYFQDLRHPQIAKISQIFIDEEQKVIGNQFESNKMVFFLSEALNFYNIQEQIQYEREYGVKIQNNKKEDKLTEKKENIPVMKQSTFQDFIRQTQRVLKFLNFWKIQSPIITAQNIFLKPSFYKDEIKLFGVVQICNQRYQEKEIVKITNQATLQIYLNDTLKTIVVKENEWYFEPNMLEQDKSKEQESHVEKTTDIYSADPLKNDSTQIKTKKVKQFDFYVVSAGDKGSEDFVAVINSPDILSDYVDLKFSIESLGFKFDSEKDYEKNGKKRKILMKVDEKYDFLEVYHQIRILNKYYEATVHNLKFNDEITQFEADYNALILPMIISKPDGQTQLIKKVGQSKNKDLDKYQINIQELKNEIERYQSLKSITIIQQSQNMLITSFETLCYLKFCALKIKDFLIYLETCAYEVFLTLLSDQLKEKHQNQSNNKILEKLNKVRVKDIIKFVDINKLYETFMMANTPPQCNNEVNYEILEILGDSLVSFLMSLEFMLFNEEKMNLRILNKKLIERQNNAKLQLISEKNKILGQRALGNNQNIFLFESLLKNFQSLYDNHFSSLTKENQNYVRKKLNSLKLQRDHMKDKNTKAFQEAGISFPQSAIQHFAVNNTFKSFNQTELNLKKMDADIMESMFAVHNRIEIRDVEVQKIAKNINLNFGLHISKKEFNFYNAIEFMYQVSQIQHNHREIREKMKQFRETCINDQRQHARMDPNKRSNFLQFVLKKLKINENEFEKYNQEEFFDLMERGLTHVSFYQNDSEKESYYMRALYLLGDKLIQNVLLNYLEDKDNFKNMYRSFFKVQPNILVAIYSREAKAYFGQLIESEKEYSFVKIKRIVNDIPKERLKFYHNFKTLFAQHYMLNFIAIDSGLYEFVNFIPSEQKSQAQSQKQNALLLSQSQAPFNQMQQNWNSQKKEYPPLIKEQINLVEQYKKTQLNDKDNNEKPLIEQLSDKKRELRKRYEILYILQEGSDIERYNNPIIKILDEKKRIDSQRFELENILYNNEFFTQGLQGLFGALFLYYQSYEKVEEKILEFFRPYIEVYQDLASKDKDYKNQVHQLLLSKPYTKNFKLYHKTEKTTDPKTLQEYIIIMFYFFKLEIRRHKFKSNNGKMLRLAYKELLEFLNQAVKKFEIEIKEQQLWTAEKFLEFMNVFRKQKGINKANQEALKPKEEEKKQPSSQFNKDAQEFRPSKKKTPSQISDFNQPIKQVTQGEHYQQLYSQNPMQQQLYQAHFNTPIQAYQNLNLPYQGMEHQQFQQNMQLPHMGNSQFTPQQFQQASMAQKNQQQQYSQGHFYDESTTASGFNKDSKEFKKKS